MNSKARIALTQPAGAQRIAAPLGRRTTPSPAPAEMAFHPALLLRDILAATQGLTAEQAVAQHGAAGRQGLQAGGRRDSLLGPGDLIMLQPEAPVADGELAVVHLDGASTPVLRRVHADSGWLRLVPEDLRYPVELRPAERVRILGRVLSIMRQARPAAQVSMAI